MLTPFILAYLALLWAIRGKAGRIADALAVNWLVNQCVVMMNGGYAYLPAFIAIDFLTGVYLSFYDGGNLARRASKFFIPMVALNAAGYVGGGEAPDWHYPVLFALAWAQLLAVGFGVWGNGLLEALDHTLCSVRVSLSRAASFFSWGRK